MLISFSVKNFRSFLQNQELSLVRSALGGRTDGVIESKVELGVDLLRVAAIYGPNASGKTNLLRAITFLRLAVLNSHQRWSPTGDIPVEPFLLARKSAEEEPAEFVIKFAVAKVRYEYGVWLSRKAVQREWLFAYPSGKRQVWFERDVESDPVFRFGKKFTGENRVIESLTRQNSLFLSTAAQNNHELLLPIYGWFRDHLLLVNHGSRSESVSLTAQMCSDSDRQLEVVKLLAAADLGIQSVDVKQRPALPESRKMLAAFRSALPVELRDGLPEDAPAVMEIRFKHSGGSNGGAMELPIEQESQGTIALFSLAGPALKALSEGHTLLVDELDSSLHTHLARAIVTLFNSPSTNPHGAQLVFNTHDTNLLTGDLLRRDQIWLCEKDASGATSLLPLSDYRVRKVDNIERGYLMGRFGAVPILDSMTFPSIGSAHPGQAVEGLGGVRK